MSTFDRVSHLADRLFDRIRHQQAHAVGEEGAVDGDFAALRGHKYALLVTFRRTGEAVPTPIWFGLDAAGRAYLRSAAASGKVKRIRADSRALLAPCTLRGRPTGAAVRATGRVVPKEEWAHAEAALAAAYGLGRKVYERVMDGPEEAGVYIELAPGR